MVTGYYGDWLLYYIDQCIFSYIVLGLFFYIFYLFIIKTLPNVQFSVYPIPFSVDYVPMGVT